MNEALKKMVLTVAIYIKLGKSDEEILEELKGLLKDKLQDFPENDFKNLIQKTRESLTKEDKEKSIKYNGELDETSYDDLVHDVTELYAQDLNDYEIKKRLEQWGVDEKYHDEICETAYEQVRKATQREGNMKILLGIGIIIVGILILPIAFNSGLGRATRLFILPFGYGAYTIYQGVVQKESM
jgi:hypothetical protein